MGILESVMNSLDRSSRRMVFLALYCALTISVSLFAQGDSHIYTVAKAKEEAARLGSSPISVQGHFWWGKEGSMIFDSGYKAVLVLRYSDKFNAKHSYFDLLTAVKSRKSDIATISGQLHFEANGRLVLIADDVQFVENSH